MKIAEDEIRSVVTTLWSELAGIELAPGPDAPALMPAGGIHSAVCVNEAREAIVMVNISDARARRLSTRLAGAAHSDLSSDEIANAVQKVAGMTAQGSGEGGNIHGTPHNGPGGWMWHIHHSSRQPLFYAHHGNVDRMWREWTKFEASRAIDYYFRNVDMVLPDKDDEWVQVRVADLSNSSLSKPGN